MVGGLKIQDYRDLAFELVSYLLGIIEVPGDDQVDLDVIVFVVYRAQGPPTGAWTGVIVRENVIDLIVTAAATGRKPPDIGLTAATAVTSRLVVLVSLQVLVVVVVVATMRMAFLGEAEVDKSAMPRVSECHK
jgi:hypothetical protein